MSEILTKPVKVVNEKSYERLAIKTHFVQPKESYIDIVRQYAEQHMNKETDILYISEKIIAISQNRIVHKSEVEPGFWARTLSKFVMKTTAGYSVGNVYKMQLAIKLAGLPRILFAAFCSAATKPFGVRGVFYRVAGHDINGIDGFYGGAFSQYQDIGILNPQNPNGVCNEIHKALGVSCVIVDANDIGVNVLGKSDSVTLSEEELIAIIKDNPAGQDNQQTPLILVKPAQEVLV